MPTTPTIKSTAMLACLESPDRVVSVLSFPTAVQMALRFTRVLRSAAAANRAVLLDIDAQGVATITLNRPDAWNTFSDEVKLCD
jgi:hypothetical protein